MDRTEFISNELGLVRVEVMRLKAQRTLVKQEQQCRYLQQCIPNHSSLGMD